MAASRTSSGVAPFDPTAPLDEDAPGPPASSGNGGTTPLRPTVPTNLGGVTARFDADTSGLDPNACSMSRPARAGLSEAMASPSPAPEAAA
eukprot:15477088-Alexandrium_andersonii.AAC.1